MKFGELPLDEALGAVLVHTTRAGDVVLKKGRVLRAQDLEALRAAGSSSVIAAVLEPDDIAEDAAAHHLALALAGAGTRMDPAKTGRCNIFAQHAGLCLVDAAEIARVNAIDERITAATIPAHSAVRAGDMVATIKIIPFSVPEPLLAAAAARDATASNAAPRDGTNAARADFDATTPSKSGNAAHDAKPARHDAKPAHDHVGSFVHNPVRIPDREHIVRVSDSERQARGDGDHHVRNSDKEVAAGDNVRIPDDRVSVRDPDDQGAMAATPGAAVVVHPWRGKRAGLVLTRFAETHPSLLAKAEAAQRERMRRCGGELAERRIVPHRAEEVEAALRELAAMNLDPILMLGASAIMDRRDVLPAAIERAGGTLIRFGMPVDPGNLLLLARLPWPAGGHTNHGSGTGQTAAGEAADQTHSLPGAAARAIDVIGVPSCARSLKRSGFDWVLERCCAGIPVTSADIAALGVGGLLDEIELRPAPRREEAPLPMPPRIAAIVLAAGLGSRMEAAGGAKLLVELDGQPMVRHAVRAALASGAAQVIVVTGHRADEVRAALAELEATAARRLRLIHNPDYAGGMASSLRAGIGQAADADGAVVCLGDMPRVTAAHIDHIIASFDPVAAPIIVPTYQRKRGNPVLWGRRFFAEIEALQGDVGARSLLERHAEEVCLLALDDDAILLDVDTPAALASARGEP